MPYSSTRFIVIGTIGALAWPACANAQAAPGLAVEQVDPNKSARAASVEAAPAKFSNAQADAALVMIERITAGEPIVSGIISQADGTSAMVDPTTNTITIVHGGGGNNARVVQDGGRNDASITQDGRGNASLIEQTGTNNSFEHVQLGDGLSMQGTQDGNGAVISVTQTPY